MTRETKLRGTSQKQLKLHLDSPSIRPEGLGCTFTIKARQYKLNMHVDIVSEGTKVELTRVNMMSDTVPSALMDISLYLKNT